MVIKNKLIIFQLLDFKDMLKQKYQEKSLQQMVKQLFLYL
jgi:hypothetical protein